MARQEKLTFLLSLLEESDDYEDENVHSWEFKRLKVADLKLIIKYLNAAEGLSIRLQQNKPGLIIDCTNYLDSFSLEAEPAEASPAATMPPPAAASRNSTGSSSSSSGARASTGSSSSAPRISHGSSSSSSAPRAAPFGSSSSSSTSPRQPHATTSAPSSSSGPFSAANPALTQSRLNANYFAVQPQPATFNPSSSSNQHQQQQDQQYHQQYQQQFLQQQQQQQQQQTPEQAEFEINKRATLNTPYKKELFNALIQEDGITGEEILWAIQYRCELN
jgi:hypothetical protein